MMKILTGRRIEANMTEEERIELTRKYVEEYSKMCVDNDYFYTVLFVSNAKDLILLDKELCCSISDYNKTKKYIRNEWFQYIYENGSRFIFAQFKEGVRNIRFPRIINYTDTEHSSNKCYNQCIEIHVCPYLSKDNIKIEPELKFIEL